MYLTSVFIFSGAFTAILVVTKWLEQKSRRTFYILEVISKGDARVRRVAHDLAHKYSDWKDALVFALTKQAPIRVRGFLNRHTYLIREKVDVYAQKARNSRLLKRDEGISEFFQSISSADKGNGQINEQFEDIPSNTKGIGGNNNTR